MEALILSTALDTNGQNARFARAAAKYGDDADVLKALSIGNDDPAGVMGRFEQAAEKYGGLHIREAHKAEGYFAFPRDLHWNRHTQAEIARLARLADVIHLNNSYRAYTLLQLRKPALLHHHGSLFRRDPAHMLNAARQYRMASAVSTIDLTRTDPKVLHWLPSAYDLDELAAVRKGNRRKPDGRIRLVSAPTNRALKATGELIAAVKRLQADGVPVDLVLVEQMPWADCLVEKAQADILFDQVMFGYGCNAIEAWGMGVPVIAGADEWTLDAMRKQWGALPFYEASLATLEAAIRALVESHDLRAEWGEKGHAHAQRFHAEKPALERLAELYGLAIKAHGTTNRLGKPVRFHNVGRHNVYTSEGNRIEFDAEGNVTVSDPLDVERLRRIAAKRPLFGITEVEA